MGEQIPDRGDRSDRDIEYADELARKSRRAIARIRWQLGNLADHLRSDADVPAEGKAPGRQRPG